MVPLILIPSRLGATRLPRKPLAEIAGLPMIVQVLKRAQEAAIGRVVVAADDAEIVAAVEAAGGEAVLTRTDHPSGSDRIYEALQAVDPEGKHEIIVNLQGDMPTIDPGIIARVLLPLRDSAVDIATLVAPIRTEEELADDAVVKPVLAQADGEGIARALYFTRLCAPWGAGDRYHHIGIYAYRRKALERFVALPPSSLELRERLEQLRALENGMRIDAAIVDTVPLGVDTEAHLNKARALLGDAA
jgi:3-deoxy-manno-octulosonate cytidylyltransferase (CMP-KDO synthetase)